MVQNVGANGGEVRIYWSAGGFGIGLRQNYAIYISEFVIVNILLFLQYIIN